MWKPQTQRPQAGEVVRATFADGHVRELSAPDTKLTVETLQALAKVLYKPTPVSVEIIETAQPQLPFQETIGVPEQPAQSSHLDQPV